MVDVLNGISPYYSDANSALYLCDTFEALKMCQTECADTIFADPPYFLSNGGISCSGGKQVSVNKGEWDKLIATQSPAKTALYKGSTFEEKHAFNRRWIALCRNVLTLNGTIWISGSFHNIYSVGAALEEEGYKIINNITWQKTNPPPNIACRCFTNSTETVLWAKKRDKRAKHVFNYALMKSLNGGKQDKDVWAGGLTPPSEKTHGKHPTQKPVYLLEKLIMASTKEGDLVLDPFCGSSTTGVACKRLGRRYIGIDNCEEYLALSAARLLDYGGEMLFNGGE